MVCLIDFSENFRFDKTEILGPKNLRKSQLQRHIYEVDECMHACIYISYILLFMLYIIVVFINIALVYMSK